MNRFHSYISTASKIIEAYDGSKPFVHYLKKFFSSEKKYGSTDRKTIASLCYSYFRVAHAFKNKPIGETILAGLFLCNHENNHILSVLHPDLNERISLPVSGKLSFQNLLPADIFPLMSELSEDINIGEFAVSFLQQPALFMRIRPGGKDIVINKLSTAAIPFEIVKEDCIKLANTTSLQSVLKINKDVVIQDLNSQQVFNFFDSFPECFAGKEKITVWDSCAASGGKSILLHDRLKGNLQLTVSDIRETIIDNLRVRLEQAGINISRYFVADLVKKSGLREEQFSVIILDAPCTGSGTWSRTPEQLYYFDKKTIVSYAERQKRIAENVVSHLKEEGLFFYITCSVFRKENEEVAAYIQEKLAAGIKGFPLRLLQMEYLRGYTEQADTMFVAVFSK